MRACSLEQRFKRCHEVLFLSLYFPRMHDNGRNTTAFARTLQESRRDRNVGNRCQHSKLIIAFRHSCEVLILLFTRRWGNVLLLQIIMFT